VVEAAGGDDALTANMNNLATLPDIVLYGYSADSG